MGRMQVVIVERIFDQQLPVGRDVVFLDARHNFHPAVGRLVDYQVYIFLRAGEIGVKIRDRAVEAGEPETAVILKPRHVLQP